MVVRLSSTQTYILELIREGKLVDAMNCDGPANCAKCACVLIARVGNIEPGDILLCRDFE